MKCNMGKCWSCRTRRPICRHIFLSPWDAQNNTKSLWYILVGGGEKKTFLFLYHADRISRYRKDHTDWWQSSRWQLKSFSHVKRTRTAQRNELARQQVDCWHMPRVIRRCAARLSYVTCCRCIAKCPHNFVYTYATYMKDTLDIEAREVVTLCNPVSARGRRTKL